MVMDSRMTVQEFVRRRHELPEAGRWHELHEGQTVCMEAPDDAHGNAVLNLSRALAEWFQTRKNESVGYACHEIGLAVEQEPATVYCPAISFFKSGKQFEESDKIVADNTPLLVVDIASSNDRRTEMRRRTMGYIGIGVHCVWVPDPMKKEVQVIMPGSHTLALGAHQSLTGQHVLPGFEMTVADVFAQPEWWTRG